MKINYCLPIIISNKQAVLREITTSKEYDFFEIWLDYVKDLDQEFIQELLKKYEEKLIFLFRRQKLEKIQMDVQERYSIIDLINETKSLLDLDILTQKEELGYIFDKKMSVNLITSYHNYKETTGNLQSIIFLMEKYQPLIYKIATVCNNESDALTLLKLQVQLKQQKKKHIVLGMEEFGIITRVFGTLWGNEFIYAPKTKNNTSAPGQLTKKQLEIIFKNI